MVISALYWTVNQSVAENVLFTRGVKQFCSGAKLVPNLNRSPIRYTICPQGEGIVTYFIATGLLHISGHSTPIKDIHYVLKLWLNSKTG